MKHSPTLSRLPDLARERGYGVEVEYEDVTSGVALPADWGLNTSVCSPKRTGMNSEESFAAWTLKPTGAGIA